MRQQLIAVYCRRPADRKINYNNSLAAAKRTFTVTSRLKKLGTRSTSTCLHTKSQSPAVLRRQQQQELLGAKKKKRMDHKTHLRRCCFLLHCLLIGELKLKLIYLYVCKCLLLPTHCSSVLICLCPDSGLTYPIYLPHLLASLRTVSDKINICITDKVHKTFGM